nr:hypothetical protein Iba_chr15aCG7050 [Ipomoea batatas]GMD96569.1 hypothetical protein Iba_chr15bCG6010 [Ipomoea batatas]
MPAILSFTGWIFVIDLHWKKFLIPTSLMLLSILRG